jgi:hypothetical protein
MGTRLERHVERGTACRFPGLAQRNDLRVIYSAPGVKAASDHLSIAY